MDIGRITVTDKKVKICVVYHFNLRAVECNESIAFAMNNQRQISHKILPVRKQRFVIFRFVILVI